MGGWLPFSKLWPTNPTQLVVPPLVAQYPTTIGELQLLELAEMAALLRIACGRSQLPLKQPKRAALCVLASVLEYEIYKRRHQ